MKKITQLLKAGRERPENPAVHVLMTILNAAAELAIILLFLIALLYGGYTVYDTIHILESADATNFETYKPVKENKMGFEDFAKANKDVIGWISLYGTQIDYPLVYSEEFDKYLNLNPQGKFALSGSIFLDNRNHPDMSDFNNIIYGHHMEAGMMFGNLDKFYDQTYFDEHEYGRLYFNGEDHGLTVFAAFKADAYDGDIYNTSIETKEEKQVLLDYIDELAELKREVGVTTDDTITLLSTCAGDTNGRYLVACKITDDVQEDTFEEEATIITRLVEGPAMSILEMLPGWWWILLVLGIFLFAALLLKPWK